MIYKLIFLFFVVFPMHFYGQEKVLEKNHAEGLAKAKAGDYLGAIESFTLAIEAMPVDAFTWYNRGMAKNMIGEYEEAIYDFNTCIGLSPTYKKVWYNRGITKMYMTDYNGALADFSQAIILDREYSEAYYHRAFVYELKGLFDFACTDYRNAKFKGYEFAENKIKACNDTSYANLSHTPLLALKGISKSKKYGRKPKSPIAIGTIENIDVYMRLLRSPQGKHLPYEIITKGDFSIISIQYEDLKKKKKTIQLYFDCKKFQEPMVIKGFKTFKSKG